jgi:hypothetical protein
MGHRPSRVLRLWAVAGGAVVAVCACATRDAVVGPPPTTGSGQYWALTLNHRAVTMSIAAPYDTMRLIAMPRDAAGNAISGFPTPSFTSSDLKSLQVDSVGVVHALATGDGILVIASLSSGTLTLADTAIVNITNVAPPPVLTVFSIQPNSGDSAEAAVDAGGASLPLRALDASGAPVDGLSVYYTTSNPRVATIDRSTGFISGVYPGRVTFTATTTAYGITASDTLPFIIGWPVVANFQAVPQTVGGRPVLGFSPGRLTMGPGATVFFDNATTTKIDVTFDNPAPVDSSPTWCAIGGFISAPWLCGTGNIAPFASDSTINASGIRVRTFPVPGTYPFHSTLFGTTGEIVVVDWRTL